MKFSVHVITFLAIVALTVKISDEETVECIDIYKQPAFNHDLLKNHKIQERPSEIPKQIEMKKKNEWQTWEAHVSAARCPEGMIPILRRNASNDRIGGSTDESSSHEHAVGTANSPQEMYGTKATISVWDPTVEQGNELSLSQIWIISGGYDKNDLNTIEVGWQVLPNLYQDNKPRLFIYWTSDAYNTTGCYNLQCPGFIQTSSSIIIGGAITPISAFEENQFEITISVWKDQKNGNWWLSLGSNQSLVGYWPAEIFTNLAYAKDIQWGGEIVNTHRFGRHTTTQMGSGHFPDEGFGKVSYFRNLEIVDKNNTLQPVQDVKVKATDPKFYNIKNMFRDDWGTCLFYGGPGFSRIHSGVDSLASSFLIYFSFIIFLLFSLYSYFYFLFSPNL